MRPRESLKMAFMRDVRVLGESRDRAGVNAGKRARESLKMDFMQDDRILSESRDRSRGNAGMRARERWLPCGRAGTCFGRVTIDGFRADTPARV